MPMSRVRFTVRRMMVALAFVIVGSLVVGSAEGINAEVADADAVVFALAYAGWPGQLVVPVAKRQEA